MFEKVIVGIDERSSGRDAVKLARALVSPGGTLTLAHIDLSFPHYGRRLTATHAKDERTRADELLGDVSAATGLTSVVRHSATSVGRGLHQLVEERGADLLVIGSTRRGPAGRVLVASATRDAINGAPCVVAIAPGAYADAQAPFREVGVAYNETREARAALAAGRELAAAHHAELSVFEAASLPTYTYYEYAVPYSDIAADALSSTQTALAEIPNVIPHAAFGDPAEELTIYSASIDLLIVGSRSFGPLGRLVHSSTSQQLTRSARCPLLLLTRTGRTAGSVSSHRGTAVPANAVA